MKKVALELVYKRHNITHLYKVLKISRAKVRGMLEPSKVNLKLSCGSTVIYIYFYFQKLKTVASWQHCPTNWEKKTPDIIQVFNSGHLSR